MMHARISGSPSGRAPAARDAACALPPQLQDGAGPGDAGEGGIAAAARTCPCPSMSSTDVNDLGLLK
jgi:hypothetical protein